MAYIQSHNDQAWLLPPSFEVCWCRVSGISSDCALLKMPVMGVIDHMRSSHRLAKNARENVVYMYFSEKLTPDFRTISDFRKDSHEVIKEAFRYTVELGKQEGDWLICRISQQPEAR